MKCQGQYWVGHVTMKVYVYSPSKRHTSQSMDRNGMVVISASLIQHLRALQYTTYLEDWECISVISANIDKRILDGFYLHFTVPRY